MGAGIAGNVARLCRVVPAALGLSTMLLVLSPIGSSATITNGSCKVTGTSTSGGSIDLTTADTWHLQSTDQVNGSATYPSQTFVHIYAYLFGIPVPVYSSSGKDTKGSAGPFLVSDYSRFTRVFAAGGSSDSCDGSVLIIVDDQNPFTNAAGLVGSTLAVLGLIGLLILMFAGTGSGGCGSTFFGLLAGLFLGLGAALDATEAGILDPRSIVGLAVIVAFVVIGGVLPTLRSRMK